MTRRFGLFVLLCAVAFAKDINPADFPETLTVSEGRTESYVAGARHDSTCDNPQGAFMQGFCSTYGHHSKIKYRSQGMSIGRIGDIEYTLLAGAFLKPAVYKARFTKGGLEVLSKEHSNKPYKLRIVGMRKLSGTSADPPGTAADPTCSGMTEDAAYREAAAWAGSHPQFKQTPENAKKIIGYMDAHGMCPSQKNFDAAYEAVKSTLE